MDIEMDKIQKAYYIYQRIAEKYGKPSDRNEWECIETIAKAWERAAPMMITELDSNEVFVFGSDEKGIHDGRASLQAFEDFGAIYGRGEGIQGNAYAIPTTKPIDENIDAADENVKHINKLLKEGKSRSDVCTEILKGKKEKKEGNNNVNKEGYNNVKKEILSEDVIGANVEKFIEYASSNKNRHFLVTRIGCGYSGYDDGVIAPFFLRALWMDNVSLPTGFLLELFEESADFDHASQLVPFKAGNCDVLIPTLEKQLALYHKWVRCQFDKEENKRNLMDTVERLSYAMVRGIDLCYRGLPATAFVELKKVLDLVLVDNSADGRIVSKNLFKEVSKNGVFYRMRHESDNWMKKTVDREGMFHIPMNMRGIVKTQRYSVPGYPCLYLAKHVLGCWEELGRPNMSNCLVSKFVNQSSFYVLDLSIPTETDWKDDFERTCIRFPMVIASTLISEDHNASFKPEYVVPQLLLQYVKEYAYEKNKHKTKNEREIYGIEYTSVNYTGNAQERETYQNYVLPVIDIKEKHCSRLKQLFHLTEPLCVEYEMPNSSMKLEDSIEKALKDRECKGIE